MQDFMQRVLRGQVSYVSHERIQTYERRSQDGSWNELSDLASTLPYPLAGPLAQYLSQTDSGRLATAAREFIECSLTIAAYVAYAGLKNLNTGFDSPMISHFSPADFLVVIDRCEPLHVRVIGIEVFASGRDFLEVEISPEDGYDWARRLVQRYQERSDVTICVTFGVP